MSNLGDRLDDPISTFRSLRDHARWRNVQEESFLPALKGALNDAASQEALDSLASTVSGLPTEDTNLSPSGVVEALRNQSVLNSDGSVGADVDNENTTSDVADFGSLSVGETGAVTGTFGDSDEWVPLAFQRKIGDNTQTGTEKKNLLGGQGRMRFNVEPSKALTGISAIGFDFSGSWTVPDGVTATAELFVFSGGNGLITTHLVDGPENFTEYSAPIGEIDVSGTINAEIRLSSSTDQQVNLRTPSVTMYGKIA